ncbi:Hpt domain-containing protein [Caulobacter endophyticus]|uniref:Hpt domain-containing protein n=1 Tax=Caulobacter endophyticus TaxID=2172652 RepID=UPI00240EF7EE|nr:Hpt domain-containing protein [Caulobacter endophyticus]MDG2531218.1 Hpt domain-containing protein [Caulobacter endophyticus]
MTTADPLAPLRAKFLVRVADDLARLRSADTSMKDRHYVVHRLAGAAGVFGYGKVTDLARELDDLLIEQGEAPPEAFAELIAALEGLG